MSNGNLSTAFVEIYSVKSFLRLWKKILLCTWAMRVHRTVKFFFILEKKMQRCNIHTLFYQSKNIRTQNIRCWMRPRKVYLLIIIFWVVSFDLLSSTCLQYTIRSLSVTQMFSQQLWKNKRKKGRWKRQGKKHQITHWTVSWGMYKKTQFTYGLAFYNNFVFTWDVSGPKLELLCGWKCCNNLSVISLFAIPEGSKSPLRYLQRRIPHKKQVVWPSEDQRPCYCYFYKRYSQFHEQEQERKAEKQIIHPHCAW